MRKLSLMASATMLAIAATAAPALAQDAPEEEPFTGFYVGGSFGYTVQPNDIGERVLFDTDRDGDFDEDVLTAADANAFSPGFCNGFSTNATPAGGCVNDRDDIEYFGRIGFDKQFGGIVVGIVGEAGKSEATDSVTAFSTTPASYTFTRSTDWQAGLRGRIGYTPGTTLFYATGGGAYAKMDHQFTSTNGANSFTGNGENDAWGWSAGGGVEQKIGRNFSLGLEYLYTRLNDDDYEVAVGPGTAPETNPFLLVDPTGTDMRRSQGDFNTHSLRATAAFRF
ncbi:porin family protein [Sphingomonas gilva]|uniref:Porin family protein n=1 Tax=Sphingomonas gilva TaxID=2305907 RepID=A0A396RQ03_9SPHN|nr:outer membrane beta-barrel protein [Sphingomonas gilva]RHW17946.1 porin family protein [Sphingomonas gilva]